MNKDTIVAPATAPGRSALAVIRLSGPQAINIVSEVFKGKELHTLPANTAVFGKIVDGVKVLDEVILTLFKAPRSFTREDLIEISTHGNPFIVQQVIALLLRKGARLAQAGEFTMRAFLNGRLDLSQAEAVADLINADSEAAHKAAMQQMRGGVFQELNQLREKLLHFASLLELELDFSEEDVAFAPREELTALLQQLGTLIHTLLSSFAAGNAIKNGIPVVIAGKPNAGKSTLLNKLLNEEKALVSEIAGTTRDVIEDEISIGGLRFRFIDTAGLRETTDTVEAMGVARSYERINKAAIILYLFDASTTKPSTLNLELQQLPQEIPTLVIANKCDLTTETDHWPAGTLRLIAKDGAGLDALQEALWEAAQGDKLVTGDAMITNLRHYEHLSAAEKAIYEAINNISSSHSTEFIAQDLRLGIHHLGSLVGTITTDDILGSIFSKFCIGK